MFGNLTKKLAKQHGYPSKCRCRKPKRHRDCLYCGMGGDAQSVCGVCKEQGIDGKLIRGTGRVICAQHKGASPI